VKSSAASAATRAVVCRCTALRWVTMGGSLWPTGQGGSGGGGGGRRQPWHAKAPQRFQCHAGTVESFHGNQAVAGNRFLLPSTRGSTAYHAAGHWQNTRAAFSAHNPPPRHTCQIRHGHVSNMAVFGQCRSAARAGLFGGFYVLGKSVSAQCVLVHESSVTLRPNAQPL